VVRYAGCEIVAAAALPGFFADEMASRTLRPSLLHSIEQRLVMSASRQDSVCHV
jgi:hypothetical protein